MKVESKAAILYHGVPKLPSSNPADNTWEYAVRALTQ
jgi:hypothetical protein